MISTVELLLLAKERDRELGGRGTDYALAKRLGWNQQRVSSLMNGARQMNDDEVVDAATLAGVDTGWALACARAERTEGSVAHPHWRRVAAALEPTDHAA